MEVPRAGELRRYPTYSSLTTGTSKAISMACRGEGSLDHGLREINLSSQKAGFSLIKGSQCDLLMIIQGGGDMIQYHACSAPTTPLLSRLFYVCEKICRLIACPMLPLRRVEVCTWHMGQKCLGLTTSEALPLLSLHGLTFPRSIFE